MKYNYWIDATKIYSIDSLFMALHSWRHHKITPNDQKRMNMTGLNLSMALQPLKTQQSDAQRCHKGVTRLIQSMALQSLETPQNYAQ